eukprot:gene70-47_t
MSYNFYVFGSVHWYYCMIIPQQKTRVRRNVPAMDEVVEVSPKKPSRLAKVDMFPKPKEDYSRSQTPLGARISLLSFTIMALLLLSECLDYAFGWSAYRTELSIEESNLGHMMMNIDIDFPLTPCHKLRAGEVAFTGKNGFYDFFEGQAEYVAQDDPESLSTVVLASFQVMSISFLQRPNTTKNVSAPSHEKFLNAYSRSLKKIQDARYRALSVSRKFVALLCLDQRVPRYKQMRIQSQMYWNFNLLTRSIIFLLEMIKSNVFQYLLDVIPTRYISGSKMKKVVPSYEYSAKWRSRPITVYMRAVPSVAFYFDMFPIKISNVFEREPFSHFLVRLCGIVGGVFVILGIVDDVVQKYEASCFVGASLGLQRDPCRSRQPPGRSENHSSHKTLEWNRCFDAEMCRGIIAVSDYLIDNNRKKSCIVFRGFKESIVLAESCNIQEKAVVTGNTTVGKWSTIEPMAIVESADIASCSFVVWRDAVRRQRLAGGCDHSLWGDVGWKSCREGVRPNRERESIIKAAKHMVLLAIEHHDSWELTWEEIENQRCAREQLARYGESNRELRAKGMYMKEPPRPTRKPMGRRTPHELSHGGENPPVHIESMQPGQHVLGLVTGLSWITDDAMEDLLLPEDKYCESCRQHLKFRISRFGGVYSCGCPKKFVDFTKKLCKYAHSVEMGYNPLPFVPLISCEQEAGTSGLRIVVTELMFAEKVMRFSFLNFSASEEVEVLQMLSSIMEPFLEEKCVPAGLISSFMEDLQAARSSCCFSFHIAPPKPSVWRCFEAAENAAKCHRVSLDAVPSALLKALLPHQISAVEKVLRLGCRALIADEMGVGKTLEALGAVAAIHGYPLLLVVPSALKVMWAEEVEKYLFEQVGFDQIYMVKGSNDALPDSVVPQVVVISFHMAAAMRQKLSNIQWRCIVCDEAHFLHTNITGEDAVYTSTVCALAKAAPHCLFLTGTPATSSPFDLFNILDAIAPGFLGESRLHFALHYCRLHF